MMSIRDRICEIQKTKEAALRELWLFDSVLDRGHVELIDLLGDDDAPIDAARVSFAKTADEYTEEQNDGARPMATRRDRRIITGSPTGVIARNEKAT